MEAAGSHCLCTVQHDCRPVSRRIAFAVYMPMLMTCDYFILNCVLLFYLLCYKTAAAATDDDDDDDDDGDDDDLWSTDISLNIFKNKLKTFLFDADAHLLHLQIWAV